MIVQARPPPACTMRGWPSVQGFVGVAVGGVVLFFLVFQLGKAIMSPLQRYKLKNA